MRASGSDDKVKLTPHRLQSYEALEYIQVMSSRSYSKVYSIKKIFLQEHERKRLSSRPKTAKPPPKGGSLFLTHVQKKYSGKPA